MCTFFKSIIITGGLIFSISIKAQCFVEPAIEEYVSRFFELCSANNLIPEKSNLVCVKFPSRLEDSLFKFDYYKPKWSGVAITNNVNGLVGVFLNPKHFYMSDETGREMLVFHELFHTCFNVPHINNILMSDIELTDSICNYYSKYRKTIIDDVFNYIKSLK